MIQIPQEFRDLLKLLNDERVRYLVIGGYAVIHHGYPRSTLDIDLWFADSPENLTALRQALRRFGFSDKAFGPLVFEGREESERGTFYFNGCVGKCGVDKVGVVVGKYRHISVILAGIFRRYPTKYNDPLFQFNDPLFRFVLEEYPREQTGG